MPSTGRSSNSNFQDYPISKRIKVAGPVYLWLVSAPYRVNALRQRTYCSFAGNVSVFRVVIIIDDEGFKEARMGTFLNPYFLVLFRFGHIIADHYSFTHTGEDFVLQWPLAFFQFVSRQPKGFFSVPEKLLVPQACPNTAVIPFYVLSRLLP